MNEHLPILQVVVPLIAAPLCLLVRHDRAVRIFAVAATWCCLAISVLLVREVLSVGTLFYDLGGWAAPWGIEYRVDLANAYVLLVVSGIASVILPMGPGSGVDAIPEGRDYLFYSAFLLCLTGLLGVTITGDAFNVFVFLEISSLASYTLIALGHERRALGAAFSYLVIGTIGASFILIGIGLLYQMTGTLNLTDLAARLPDVEGQRTVVVAFSFLLVGICVKLAVFPLHQWLPNAYSFAPSVVSAFLAATATKVAYYLLVRVVFTLFGAGYVFESLQLHTLLIPLSLLAMFVGSTAAIYQTNLKRLLAYSSVAQIGYLTLALSFGSEAGLTAGLVHVFNHAIMKGGLFCVVACITHAIASSEIADMRGLGRRMPFAAGAFVVGGLGLVGVPGTAGFVSKWYLVLAALEQGRLGIAFLVMLSSLLALIYVWRVVEVFYFAADGRASEESQPDPSESSESAGAADAPRVRLQALEILPTLLLIASIVYFGFATDLTAGLAGRAAHQLLATP